MTMRELPYRRFAAVVNEAVENLNKAVLSFSKDNNLDTPNFPLPSLPGGDMETKYDPYDYFQQLEDFEKVLNQSCTLMSDHFFETSKSVGFSKIEKINMTILSTTDKVFQMTQARKSFLSKVAAYESRAEIIERSLFTRSLSQKSAAYSAIANDIFTPSNIGE